MRYGFWLLGFGASALYVACGGSSASDVFSAADGGGDGATSGGDDGATAGDDAAGGDDSGGGGTDAGGDAAKKKDSGSLSCTKPMLNCSGNPADGCNVNVLTDSQNCGGCGANCSGGTCTNGICNLLAADAGPLPLAGDGACIAIDSTNLYFTTAHSAATGGAVYRVPLSGGVWSLVLGGQETPRGIVSDGTNLYWANSGGGNIVRASTTGANPINLATGMSAPTYLIADATRVYWLNGGDGSVWTVPKDGGSAASQVAAGVGAAHLAPYNSLALSGTNLFYSETNSGGNVLEVGAAASAATPSKFEQGLTRPWGVAANGTEIFFTVAGGIGTSTGSVNRVGVDGGTPTPLVQTISNPTGLAIDGTNAYFGTTTSSGSISKVPLGGGAVTPLAQSQSFPGCISVDATSVYWIDNGTFSVNKTGK